jgi:hypothetical protein
VDAPVKPTASKPIVIILLEAAIVDSTTAMSLTISPWN